MALAETVVSVFDSGTSLLRYSGTGGEVAYFLRLLLIFLSFDFHCIGCRPRAIIPFVLLCSA